jgi:hypothetical protein
MWSVPPELDAAPMTVDESISDTTDLCARARSLMRIGEPREPAALFILEAIDRSAVLLSGPKAERRRGSSMPASGGPISRKRIRTQPLSPSLQSRSGILSPLPKAESRRKYAACCFVARRA